VIEQDADLILAIYREGSYTPDAPEKAWPKSSFRGARPYQHLVKLTFLGEYTRFGNLRTVRGLLAFQFRDVPERAPAILPNPRLPESPSPAADHGPSPSQRGGPAI
jgi:hypothetical protein